MISVKKELWTSLVVGVLMGEVHSVYTLEGSHLLKTYVNIPDIMC